MSLRILLLSAYDAPSHRRWRLGLVTHLPEYQWTTLHLPPRFFSWRLRGNPLTWAYGHADVLEQPYDRVVATSMVDLAALRGLVPQLAQLPTIVYFHENQFAYPIREPAVQREVFHFCMHNLTTALCADRLVFNSDYNRETFFKGVRGLLRKMPDQVPKGIVQQLEKRAETLAVPLEPSCFQEREYPPDGPLTLLWNHRWEYDKAPERLFRAVTHLQERGIHFRLHVVGQQFRQQPAIFAQARKTLSKFLGEWGYVEDLERYRALLRTSDLAISTALHDFQGLALLEAVAAGCHPVVPNRLAYPQWIPEAYRYPSYPEDEETEALALADHINKLSNQLEALRATPPPDLQALSWTQLAPRYRQLLER